jgi:chemotaxis protein MotA
MAARGKKKAGRKPDLATIGGFVFALVGIVGGLLLEGGEIADISQYTAAVIVLGGTAGAVLINTPMRVVRGAIAGLGDVLFEKADESGAVVEALVDCASRARKNGLVALEADANNATDPFLKKALTLAVDGTDLQELRKMLEIEIDMEEHRKEAVAKVYDAAGGYAPTIGIIGAVMGLIQVMKNLSDIDKVGHGIAVSFVATVYGVAVANLFLLPAANKIRARAQDGVRMQELVLAGVIGIVEGLNPKLIRSALEAYVEPEPVKKKKA